MSAEVQPECSCDSPAVDQLRDLITAGWGQRDASVALWGTGGDVRLTVWLAFTSAFPWLRVPPPRPGAATPIYDQVARVLGGAS